MPLTSASLKLTLSWAMSRSNSGGFAPTEQGRDARSFNLAALDLSDFDNVFAARYSIAAARAAPVQSAASARSGGSLVDTTTYYWVVTALSALGETVASNERSLAVAAPDQTARLAWAAVTGATGYKVYRTTSSGTYGASSLVTTLGAVLTYDDTGSATVTGAPPAANTTATQDVDLSSFTNLVCEAVAPGHALTLLVLPAAGGGGVEVKPGATNGLTWFFSDPSDGIKIRAGGVHLLSEPAAGPGEVIDGTHKVLSFRNTHASLALTLDVVAIVGS